MAPSDTTRKRALKLLARGMMTGQEAATLAKVSRQLVRHWYLQAGIDPVKTRQAYLRTVWGRAR